MTSIITNRLELVPATPDTTRAALAGADALGAGLDAVVPSTWPPEYLDAPALEFTLKRLSQGAQQEGWWLHFVILPNASTGRTLIGSAGYKGPPQNGTVEVGYGIVSDHRRRGYATELTHGLVAHAFQREDLQRVIAETLPELTPSIGVLTKCGFRLIGAGSEPGVIRYELTRNEYERLTLLFEGSP